MEIRKKKHAQHVNLLFQVIGFGWEPVRWFHTLPPPPPVVYKAVRMCQGALDFYSGAILLEIGKCLTQQAIIDYCVLDFWRSLERDLCGYPQLVKLHLSFVWNRLYLLHSHCCPPVMCIEPDSVGILSCFSYIIWTRHMWSSCLWSTESLVWLLDSKSIWSQA